MLKRILASALGLLALCSAALAQVNVVPGPGVITGFIPAQTFRAVSIGLTIAATPTDFFCISGSQNKKVTITRLDISGTASTGVDIPLVLLRRILLDTGGTAATTIANPANTIGRNISTNGAATATLIAYTANPTINDTSPTYFGSYFLDLAATTTNAPIVTPAQGGSTLTLSQLLTIPSGQTTQQYCLNGNSTAATLTGNSINVTIEWTEQ